MTRPYSVDLRERVVRPSRPAYRGGRRRDRFEVSVSFVIKLMQRWRRRGTVAPDRTAAGSVSALAAHAERVRDLLVAEPDLTIAELRSRLAAEGIDDEPGGDQPVPQRRRPDAKKKTQHAAEQERPDVAAARAAWRMRQPALSPERLVFLDETWAKTNMARRYGRARRGRRVVAAVPHGHWKTTTFLAALRHDRITAPCVFDGAINGERFLAWVEQALAPTLRLRRCRHHGQPSRPQGPRRARSHRSPRRSPPLPAALQSPT